VILKSRILSRTSDTTETRNPCVIKVILLACFTYIDIFNLLNFWAEIYRRRLFLGPILVSFNRAVVPYEISKVNIRVETKILVSMSEEI
jgi:hypothetical protein